jgi:hypothetical protein
MFCRIATLVNGKIIYVSVDVLGGWGNNAVLIKT